ncbi:MAG: hypothetical protein WDA20_03280 [Desulfuromonadales bacterium]
MADLLDASGCCAGGPVSVEVEKEKMPRVRGMGKVHRSHRRIRKTEHTSAELLGQFGLNTKIFAHVSLCQILNGFSFASMGKAQN